MQKNILIVSFCSILLILNSFAWASENNGHSSGYKGIVLKDFIGQCVEYMNVPGLCHLYASDGSYSLLVNGESTPTPVHSWDMDDYGTLCTSVISSQIVRSCNRIVRIDDTYYSNYAAAKHLPTLFSIRLQSIEDYLEGVVDNSESGYRAGSVNLRELNIEMFPNLLGQILVRKASDSRGTYSNILLFGRDELLYELRKSSEGYEVVSAEKYYFNPTGFNQSVIRSIYRNGSEVLIGKDLYRVKSTVTGLDVGSIPSSAF